MSTTFQFLMISMSGTQNNCDNKDHRHEARFLIHAFLAGASTEVCVLSYVIDSHPLITSTSAMATTVSILVAIREIALEHASNIATRPPSEKTTAISAASACEPRQLL
jgi:hypothetical protein